MQKNGKKAFIESEFSGGKWMTHVQQCMELHCEKQCSPTRIMLTFNSNK